MTIILLVVAAVCTVIFWVYVLPDIMKTIRAVQPSKPKKVKRHDFIHTLYKNMSIQEMDNLEAYLQRNMKKYKKR